MRLSTSTLDRLPIDIARPAYDRGAVTTGVIHLGIGAFHRAHQARLFDDLLAGGDLRWGVLGVSLRSPAVRDALAPQDHLYTLVERDGSGERTRVIGALTGILVAPEDPGAVIAALASPDVHLVTLTVTEKGYKLDPLTGALLADDADVAADLASLTRPRTTPGFLVAGLAARRAAGIPPFTPMSCDNIPHNGTRLRDAVLAMADAHDPALAAWIAEEGAFPETMIDRIVPATTEAEIAAFAARTGIEDRALVIGEPFLQWVIEDRFAGPRPDLAAVGAQLTDQVAPWEEAKLRLLNGAHSGIAYLGGLAGIDFVHEVIALPAGRRFVETLWDESAATLTPPPGLDVTAYRAALMTRFANPALQHRTRQIAMDGSQKLPQRLLAPLSVLRERDLPFEALALAVAAWMRWQDGVDDNGERILVDDPLAGHTAQLMDAASSPREQVDALMEIEAVFPATFARDTRLRAMLIKYLQALRESGAAVTMATMGGGDGRYSSDS